MLDKDLKAWLHSTSDDAELEVSRAPARSSGDEDPHGPGPPEEAAGRSDNGQQAAAASSGQTSPPPDGQKPEEAGREAEPEKSPASPPSIHESPAATPEAAAEDDAESSPAPAQAAALADRSATPPVTDEHAVSTPGTSPPAVAEDDACDETDAPPPGWPRVVADAEPDAPASPAASQSSAAPSPASPPPVSQPVDESDQVTGPRHEVAVASSAPVELVQVSEPGTEPGDRPVSQPPSNEAPGASAMTGGETPEAEEAFVSAKPAEDEAPGVEPSIEPVSETPAGTSVQEEADDDPASRSAGPDIAPAEPTPEQAHDRPSAAGSPAAHASHEDHPFSTLWMPDEASTTRGASDLAQVVCERGGIDHGQLTVVRNVAQRSPGRRMSDILYEMGVPEPTIQQCVAHQAGLSFETIDPDDLEPTKYLNRLGFEFCKSNLIYPLRQAGPRLILGVVYPDNMMLVDEVRLKLGMSIKPVVVCRDDILAAIENLKDDEEEHVDVDEIIGDIDEDDVEVVESKDEQVDLEKMAGESPVIRFVNYLIFNAVKEGASDIHIEPQEKKLVVRFRIDGVLFEMMNPPHAMHAAIISRLKIMANLDISERRLPQDGRIRAMVHGRKLDLRLSTLPTAQGEKSVLRILDTRSINVTLDELGMGEDTLLIWKNQISNPHGIILVTGPTGSGKTTTLYSSLGQMDKQKLNISTVEDPVEYHLSGITQTQTHESIGMTFAAALRALLRQDPDVIMVGEVRDKETATIAIQAALTGHLVLSTLHTNDAPSSVTRLINIGVEPYLIGSAVNSCLAQRLVRKICPNCREQVKPDDHVAEHLAMHGIAMDQVWKGKGCGKCRNTGYSGRVGLYELLLLDDHLRDRIASNPNVTEFRRICVERGMRTLRDDGFAKVAQGLTTVDEILRVTESTI